MAVGAHVRGAAAQHLGGSPRRVSFLQIRRLPQQRWQTCAWRRRARTARQPRAIVANFSVSVERLALLPERRARACRRAVPPARQLPAPQTRPTFALRHCISARSVVALTALPLTVQPTRSSELGARPESEQRTRRRYQAEPDGARLRRFVGTNCGSGTNATTRGWGSTEKTGQ